MISILYSCILKRVILISKPLEFSKVKKNAKLMNYSAEYTGALVSVKWRFGDGSTGTDTMLTSTYAAAGTYEAKVKKDGSEYTSIPKRTFTVN